VAFDRLCRCSGAEDLVRHTLCGRSKGHWLDKVRAMGDGDWRWAFGDRPRGGWLDDALCSLGQAWRWEVGTLGKGSLIFPLKASFLCSTRSPCGMNVIRLVSPQLVVAQKLLGPPFQEPFYAAPSHPCE
jgi:hypothetical protein